MEKTFDLLSTVEYGGCSAKLPPEELDRLLTGLPIFKDANILVGYDTHDDASVYKINDETALISTTDFFPPVCSDPYEFGQIAAANSLSDIYAMGGRGITALNILMFPSKKIDLGVMRDILAGGADTALKAEVVLSGGHTLDDYPPKYGLAVTGVVHPGRIIQNDALRPGEVLLLTKPLGVGVLIAGQRIGEARQEDYRKALDNMKVLNRMAAVLMQKYGIRAATDVTGFSLLGHGLKMAQASGVAMVLESRKLPILPGAYDLVDEGCIPGAAFRNLSYTEKHIAFASTVDYNLKMLCADAQTSGGILLSCPEDRADGLLKELLEFYPESCKIGNTLPYKPGEAFITLV